MAMAVPPLVDETFLKWGANPEYPCLDEGHMASTRVGGSVPSLRPSVQRQFDGPIDDTSAQGPGSAL